MTTRGGVSYAYPKYQMGYGRRHGDSCLLTYRGLHASAFEAVTEERTVQVDTMPD